MPLPFRVSIQRRPSRGLGRTALLVATLALAIAANTVLFSIVNVFVLRPLPMAQPERVGFVFGTDTLQDDARARSSIEDFLDLSERSRSFEELAAFRPSVATLTGHGEPERLVVEQASATLFPAWGLRTELGRGLSADDDRPGAPPVALLSHRSWRERFDGTKSVLGTTLTLDGIAYTVVGVMPAVVEIGNLRKVEVWLPLAAARGAEPRERRDLFVCGRLRAGVDHSAASAEIEALSAALKREHPETNGAWTARVVTTRQGLIGDGVWVVLGFLGLVVTGVLVVACANVANVLLAEIGERRSEMATRAALGANAGRIVRGLLAEQARLAVLAALLGLGLAALGIEIVQATSYEPVWQMLVIDHRVLLFVALLGGASVALAGALPALDAARGDLRAILGAGESRGATSRRGARLKRVLAAAQLAAAVVVVVPASLVNRSIQAEGDVDWGFDDAGLSAARVELPEQRYPDPDARRQFAGRLLELLASESTVGAAALVEPLPIFAPERIVGFELPGASAARPEDRPRAALVAATPELFETLGVAALAGERLSAAASDSPLVRALVNRAFAERHFPGAPAVGRTVRLADPSSGIDELEIAGVVADVRSPDLTRPPAPTIYLPFAAVAPERFSILIRSADEATGTALVRRAVHELDPLLALERPASLLQLHREERSSNETIGGLFSAFAAIAVALALVGLYAIATFAVAQRQREFGVRMALGADRRTILRSVLVDGARLAAWGGGVGLALGAGLAQLLRSRLYGVSALDPWTFGGAAVGLALFTLLALMLPARRAARLDPSRLLHVQ